MKKIPEFSIVIGLGNIGREYENTFHNAGFIALNVINKEKSSKKWKVQKKEGFEFIKSEGKTLVKPLTYMNNSGFAVKNCLKYFKAQIEDVLIAHDDSDLPIGKWKLETNRGGAGHHGIESIIHHLDTKNFWRLRLGIRNNAKEKASEFVLNQISKSERGQIVGAVEDALSVISK